MSVLSEHLWVVLTVAILAQHGSLDNWLTILIEHLWVELSMTIST